MFKRGFANGLQKINVGKGIGITYCKFAELGKAITVIGKGLRV
jgi:hypothetical protein